MANIYGMKPSTLAKVVGNPSNEYSTMYVKYEDYNKLEKKIEKLKSEDVACPFCGEDDFDLIGLKYHIENHCNTFINTPKPESHTRMARADPGTGTGY